ncbi:hypothetical protein AB3S75_022986 [Citrus x aurantiifolia]
MEAAAGVAAPRGGSLPMPSSRKEWRAVSDHHPVRNVADEVELEQSKLGQSDERTIYEQGREPADVDFCSITMDGSLNIDLLQQRLHSVARQREDLQNLEIELRTQMIARTEFMEMQSNFDSQIKEHVNAATKLQEQLLEREQTILELERKMDEKDRELLAIKRDNEAAWAKEDLFREQNKELATFRRERDQSDAERAQHIKQMHDLQEHIQEKERQLIDLQEQHRVAQETIIYKDEQLREAQAWVARVQLQSSTNHSLQAELRERTEQFNQLWLGCQRQFAEMERLHLHTIQQLQRELADARERSGTFTDDSHISHNNSKDATQFAPNNGNQLAANGGALSGNTGILPNGNSDSAESFASSGNASTLSDRVPGVPIAPSSLSHIPQSHVGHFHSMPTISSLQQWQDQQATSEGSQISASNQHPSSHTDQNHMSQGTEPASVISSSTVEAQVLESMDRSYLAAPQPEKNLQQISSQFHDALRLNALEHNSESKNDMKLTDRGLQGEVVKAEPSSTASASPSDSSINSINLREAAINDDSGAALPEVRTIPAGGRIRISSTLPNRLGKMLAPLHWHDYKKQYGKLDDFVASHPEFFVIEGDYIQLREGAQEMIAATAAVAKVAAAAAASSPYSSFLPSVAVTPMAQSRLKKVPSIDSNSVIPNQHLNGVSFGMAGGFSNVKILSKPREPFELNGANFERSSVISAQSKGSPQGRPNPNFVGKQQSRPTGAAANSRR